MEEFIKPVESSSSSEELLSKEDRQVLKNKRLLEACSLNDTEKAAHLIDDGADCCYEDSKQWSPLLWASTNGNLVLVRKLLAAGAATTYLDHGYGYAAADNLTKQGSSMDTRGSRSRSPAPSDRTCRRKRYTPLHWAAFKGHLRIVWLLIKAGLSPHARDALGNTVLHQAAAGGDVATIKTILSLGVDVDAKNGRGHTAVALAGTEGSKRILEAASAATQCKATGEHFSYKVMRHMCSFTEAFFASTAVNMFWTFETAEDEAKEKPVTWCHEAMRQNQAAEARILAALDSESLEEVDAALLGTADFTVCPKLRRRILHQKSKLEAETALRQAMDIPELSGDDGFFEAIELLSAAINDGVSKECNEGVLKAARTKLRKIETELEITRLLRKPSYDNFIPSVQFINALTDVIQSAEDFGANSALLASAVETKQRVIDYL
ncbi:ankyrin repeat-containing protein [Besnoitia besnoiti]|uniref:Ankyrin repeat-containing protein n=1 Tax=Besnoitia besnoiti TaxID=94643 RepID=A0A2A9MN12_BESBE|nr:ankyrin repeat-containing protein [Besnoitia besnoiti]PFH37207.1 ankyrin repeat-containing protein [Besnoitia besnoiti]